MKDFSCEIKFHFCLETVNEEKAQERADAICEAMLSGLRDWKVKWEVPDMDETEVSVEEG